MDDRVAGTLARRVIQRLVVEDESPALDDREQEQEEDRRDEDELDESLTDGSSSTTCTRGGCAVGHGRLRSVMAKTLDRWNVSVVGSPYVTPKISRFSGTKVRKL